MSNLEKKSRNPKIIDRQYAVKLNGEVVVTKRSRKEINDYVRTMRLDDTIHTVELVRHNITEYSIQKFKTSTQKVLVSADLSLDIDEE